MIEFFLFGAMFLVAWRVPALFDYFIIAPVIGTSIGLFVWSIEGLYGIDIWHLRTVANHIVIGTILMGIMIKVFSRGV